MISKSKTPAILSMALAIFVTTGIATINSAHAHGGAKGIVKERMTMMKSMGDDMKKVGAMIKGQAPFEADKISVYAKSITETAPEIDNLFPEGSIQGPSEALPAIWEQWDQFSAMNDDLALKAKKMQEAADGGDRRSIIKEFAQVGKVCKGCHTDYRKKKEQKDK